MSPQLAYGLPHEPSYWSDTGYTAQPLLNSVDGDIDCDVAIIGAGISGLSTAYHLAKEYGVKPQVMEAHRIGWGCSGRSGGFAMVAIGKESYQGWIAQHGVAGALKLFNYSRDAVRSVRSMLADNHIDAASPNEGYLYLAHKPGKMKELRDTQSLLKDKFGFETELLDKDEVCRNYVNSQECFGALLHPEHVPVHPMRYVQGLANAAAAVGAIIHEASPVLGWESSGGTHTLRTIQGSVRARKVVIATGGYTSETLYGGVAGKLLNILTNIIVTPPLTPAQREACGWISHQMLVDSRMLRFYFRLLEDNRIMFGARGGIYDTPQSRAKMKRWLLKRLVDFFPSLGGIQADYFWHGYIDIARDKYLHLGSSSDHSVYYALGYAGTGIAAATHSGKHLAAMIMGSDTLADIPKLTESLPSFEVPALRRVAQRLAYAYYYFKDEYL